MISYKEFAIGLAREAGDIIRKNFCIDMKREWKEDNSPVTITDMKINSLLIEGVKSNFPDHGVIGEEESLMVDSKYQWVCDPVDGTIPFSHGIPVCTFSLALVHDGEPIIGVVYDPFGDRLFIAEKGSGAFLNGEKISVSSQADLYNSVISFELFARAKYQIWGIDRILEEKGVKTTKLASVVYPSSLVAAGIYLATIFPNDTAHDMAAVKIIVEEAGGKVTDLFGNEQRYDQPIKGAIVSNGKVHDHLVAMVKETLEDK
jgi:fructose-1,6-bisphosphatase/inositol monophosphatase family enzyme